MRTRFLLASVALALTAVPAIGRDAPQPAPAAQEATAAEIAMFRDLEKQLWDAWSKDLKAKDAAPFYSKKPGTLHFDLAPLKFVGWPEYEVEAQKALPKEGGTAKVVIADDFQVIKGGPNLAIVMFTSDSTFFRPDGTQRGGVLKARETDVWEKEADGKWRITHQHLSAVLGHGGSQAPAPKP